MRALITKGSRTEFCAYGPVTGTVKIKHGSVESNGTWDKYETYEQRQARIGGESADMLGGFFAGGIAAAPVLLIRA